jgi:hypothetical protein
MAGRMNPLVTPPTNTVRFLVERRRHFSEGKARSVIREIMPKLARDGIHRGTPSLKPSGGGFFYIEIEPDLDGHALTEDTLTRWLGTL